MKWMLITLGVSASFALLVGLIVRLHELESRPSPQEVIPEVVTDTKPNTELITARQEIDRLEKELAAAKQAAIPKPKTPDESFEEFQQHHVVELIRYVRQAFGANITDKDIRRLDDGRFVFAVSEGAQRLELVTYVIYRGKNSFDVVTPEAVTFGQPPKHVLEKIESPLRFELEEGKALLRRILRGRLEVQISNPLP